MAFRPGNHDKAWNDPPVFAYQPTTTGPPQNESGPNQPASSKRTFLNKRVAFPMTANSSTQLTNTATPFGGLPPPLSLPPSGIPPPFAAQPACPVTQHEEEAVDDSEKNLQKVKEILDTLIKSLKDVAPEKVEDASKRLQSLYSGWKEGKLNADIRSRLVRLCDHLERDEFEQAESLQISLAVDYTAECSGWVVALKTIIVQSKSPKINTF